MCLWWRVSFGAGDGGRMVEFGMTSVGISVGIHGVGCGGARARRFGGAGLSEGTEIGRGIAVIRIRIGGVEDVAVGGGGGGGALESIVAARARRCCGRRRSRCVVALVWRGVCH